jgi:hypothetical protein
LAIPFDERTPGDLLEEYYLCVASEINGLLARRADLSTEELERLSLLQDSLEPETDGLPADEWHQEFRTGDPLGDYWEYRLARDLPVDLEMSETDVPPRSEWDRH